MNDTKLPVFEADGGRMPVLGFGTFQLKDEACRSGVRMALELGYRHLDTARMYKNEVQVGQGMKDAGVDRDAYFLTTKLKMYELDAAGVRRACESSLRELDTPYVDLLLIHWPEEMEPLGETLEAMGKLREEGKTRHIGVSNFPVAWMKRALELAPAPIFCNQVEYHLYLSQQPLLDLCRAHQVALVAYSPLARGKVLEDARLQAIGSRHGKTSTQVALRWLVEQEGVVAIPKATSRDHILANMDLFDFELSDEDHEVLNALEKDQRLIAPPWSPPWDA